MQEVRTLLLLRHGKAQPDAPNGDKERALIERGLRDSAAMGRKLLEIVGRLDNIVSSDARRAHQTALLAAASAGYTGSITLDEDIYDASLQTLLNVVQRLPDSARCVLLVGHNPGFEELCTALAGDDAPPSRLPTAGLAHIEFDVARWRDVRPGMGRLQGVYTPKSLGS